MKNILTVLLSLIVLNVAAQKDSVLLRLNPKKGTQSIITMTTKMDSPIVKVKNTMKMKSKIIDVNDKEVVSEVRFERILLDTDAMGQVVHYDSDMKVADMDENARKVNEAMAKVKEMVVVATANKLGKVIDIKGVEGEYANMFKQNNSVTFPEKAVGVGSMWRDSVEFNLQNTKMFIKSLYKVTAITDNTVVISISGDVDGNKVVKESSEEPIKITSNIDNGEYVVNRHTGGVVSLKLVMTTQVMGQEMKSTTIMTSEDL